MSSLRQKRKRGHVLRSLSCVYFDKIVGSGTFGVVFKAVEKETGDKVALKKIKMERESDGFPITVRIYIIHIIFDLFMHIFSNHIVMMNLFDDYYE